MSEPAHNRSPSHASRAAARASVAAGMIIAAAGGLVIYGWSSNVEAFKTIYGPITMKTNTAIGLVLCGLSLAILRWLPRLATLLAIAAGLIGAATLSEILAGWNLGIDEYFFTEAPGAAATASPNRMGPNGAISLVLAAVSLYQLARGTARGATFAQRVAFVALVLPAIAITGYLYGAAELYGLARFTGIALHTALAFTVLNLGVLMARADLGPMAVMVDEGPAATMLRRLAMPIVAIPLVLGYVEIYARNVEVVDRGLGMALFAVSLIVVLGVTVWHTAKAIDRSDLARRQAERERDGLIVSEQEARAEAERANRLKDQFLATLSHELRTPLNVVLGWTQILERGAHPDRHAHIAGLVAKNGRLLARLVEDLLDLSRVTAGQFKIARAPMNLNTVVESCLESIRPMAAAKGVDIVAELDQATKTIDADAERIQQIVWNLLSNAVKFTGAGGRIVIQTAEAAEGSTLVVADTGIGFDDAFASEVFKPFRQADSSSSREHGGLGLGLSIARHIAELHGGSLIGSSAGIGQGARFTLQLPQSSDAPAPTAVSAPARSTADETGDRPPDGAAGPDAAERSSMLRAKH